MSLYALTGTAEVADAYAVFAAYFTTGGEPFVRQIGSTGGSETATVRWFADLGIWALLDAHRAPGRYSLIFGVDDPTAVEALTVTCELNPPHSGIDRRSAGVFARSGNGPIYVAHNGKVGGGRVGVGRITFMKFYGDQATDTITWPDRKQQEAIVIGDLHDDDFPANMAAFVKSVARYKNGEME